MSDDSKTIVQRKRNRGWFFLKKLIRVPIFRLSLQDRFSRFVIRSYERATYSGSGFNSSRAQQSVDRFVALSAQIHFVHPSPGPGEIQMMHFRAQDLKKKIEALHGSWKRIYLREEKQVVWAILDPRLITTDWQNFKEKLRHFRWRETAKGALITCDQADTFPCDLEHNPRCFLFVHSTSSSFSSDWKRAGFYLGAHQDICFFDNGNTWKNKDRIVSESSFYEEVDAVYDTLQHQDPPYPVSNIWVGGHCGGAPIAAHLKKRLHLEGVNYFVEQGFADLDDFVRPLCSFSWVRKRVKNSLHTESGNPEKEFDFSIREMWSSLPRNKEGQLVFVEAQQDEHLSRESFQSHLALCKRVNEDVLYLSFRSQSAYHHGDTFLNYATCRKRFYEFVFQDHIMDKVCDYLDPNEVKININPEILKS